MLTVIRKMNIKIKSTISQLSSSTKMLFLQFFAISIFLRLASLKKLPPDMKRCSKSDPNLNKCLDIYVMEGVRKLSPGYRDLGVVPLEPLFVEKFELGNWENSTRPVSLHQSYTNVSIYGITSATIRETDANFSAEDCHLYYNSNTPSVSIVGDYRMTGKLLVFPLNGFGKCNITHYDIDGRNEFKCEKYTKKGKTYIRMIDHIFKIRPKSVFFYFENLIDGNEQLSNELLRTLNENSLLVLADMIPSLEKIMAKIWIQCVNAVFDRVPENELFLP